MGDWLANFAFTASESSWWQCAGGDLRAHSVHQFALRRLITVIEVLSPSNKGTGRARRETYVQSRVNLVELDLLRGGAHTVAVLLEQVRKPAGAFYLACVTRATSIGLREVYATPLRQPLPGIRIPLRPEETDITLFLQPLVDLCYRMGGYWNADQTNLPGPPLNADDVAWVAEQVKAAGLAG